MSTFKPTKIIKGRCKEVVLAYYGSRWPDWHQCYSKPVRDGYCRLHHPEAKVKREKEKQQRWEESMETRPMYSRRYVIALEKEIEDLKRQLRKK